MVAVSTISNTAPITKTAVVYNYGDDISPRFGESIVSILRMPWDHKFPLPFWTAPAERQRRRRFGLLRDVWTTRAASESGVALRFPPQSKTWRQFEWFMESGLFTQIIGR